jgi:hypothetical protein
VAAHDWLDGLSGLISVVERDRADVVVKNVGFDDAVEESAADEAKFSVNGCSGTTNIVPASGGVVRKRRICVLEIGNGNWDLSVHCQGFLSLPGNTYQASG